MKSDLSTGPQIIVSGLSKWYSAELAPPARFWYALRFGGSVPYELFARRSGFIRYAVHPISFKIFPGEVIGIVGKNGAGKSTLLQLLCGTLQPSAGSVQIRGKIAALLELGAGFNPSSRAWKMFG